MSIRLEILDGHSVCGYLIMCIEASDQTGPDIRDQNKNIVGTQGTLLIREKN